MKWQKKLNKGELKHIKETTDAPTLSAFKSNREHHHEMKKKDGIEPCYDCRHIAVKLGLE